MTGYTPTTEEVREAISEWAWARRMFRPELGQSDGLEADRWLAAHDAEVLRAAATELEESIHNLDPAHPPELSFINCTRIDVKLLCERADRTEARAGVVTQEGESRG